MKKGLSIRNLDKTMREGIRRSSEPIGDGVALRSIAHPPGLIEKIAAAIRDGRLKTYRERKKK